MKKALSPKKKIKKPLGVKKASNGIVPTWSKLVMTYYNEQGILNILHLEEDSFFFQVDSLLGETASLINGKRSLQEILLKVSKKHKVSIEELSRATDGLLKDLRDQKLLE